MPRLLPLRFVIYAAGFLLHHPDSEIAELCQYMEVSLRLLHVHGTAGPSFEDFLRPSDKLW